APPRYPPLFPYTTLFRSKYAADLTRARSLLKEMDIAPLTRHADVLETSRQPHKHHSPKVVARYVRTLLLAALAVALVYMVVQMRSEEHTSELQSRFDLVC